MNLLNLKYGLYAFLLYVSGPFLAVLTPLPLVLLYGKAGRQAFSRVLGVSFIAMAGVYLGLEFGPLSFSFNGTTLTGRDLAELLPRLLWYPSALPALHAIYGILQYGVYVGIAIFLVVLHEKKGTLTHAFYVALVAFAIGCGLLAALVRVEEGRSLYALLREGFTALFTKMASLDKQDFELLPMSSEKIAAVMVRFAIGANFMWVWVIVLCNLSLLRRFSKGTIGFAGVGEFVQWRLPFYGVWVVIASALVLFVHAYVTSPGFLVDIGVTLLVVSGGLYFTQGLAIVSFFLHKWQAGPFVRVAVYLLIAVLAQIFAVVLAAFGFFDAWLDVRRLEKEKTSGSHPK